MINQKSFLTISKKNMKNCKTIGFLLAILRAIRGRNLFTEGPTILLTQPNFQETWTIRILIASQSMDKKVAMNMVMKLLTAKTKILNRVKNIWKACSKNQQSLLIHQLKIMQSLMPSI